MKAVEWRKRVVEEIESLDRAVAEAFARAEAKRQMADLMVQRLQRLLDEHDRIASQD